MYYVIYDSVMDDYFITDRVEWYTESRYSITLGPVSHYEAEKWLRETNNLLSWED